MGGLANIFEVLGTEPLARWLTLALALRALWTVATWRRAAAAVARRPQETAEAIEARRQAMWRHSSRFFTLMILGIGLAIAGLFGLASRGVEQPAALAMLMGGMYLFLTEPQRQHIADTEDRVAAAQLRGDPEVIAFALAVMRSARRDLALIEIGAALAIGLAILALAPDISMMDYMPAMPGAAPAE